MTDEMKELKIGERAYYNKSRIVTLVEFDGDGNVWVDEENKECHCVNLDHLNPITQSKRFELGKI